MTCLNCQKHFSEHDESELFICINFYSSQFILLAENYHKLFDDTQLTKEVNHKRRPKFQWPLKDKDYGDDSLK